jgi:hypothetical protein
MSPIMRVDVLSAVFAARRQLFKIKLRQDYDISAATVFESRDEP